ncbi:MAG: hypothetical protein U0989_20295 [Azonexus sp.]|nr:hypothetical protein [Azonexus sp.]MDP3637913.1 hypothetical protein [Azonexus sp.]MDZ4317091.1 hypothetical protein [Azonexus sp.]
MVNIFRKTFAHPVLAIGSTVLWGIIELVALSRAGRSKGGGSA